MAETIKYNRLLLKLSGEALMGDNDYGINIETATAYAQDIKAVIQAGVEIAIVVGGGNIFRGVQGVASGMDRTDADTMGMLATIINGIAFANILESQGVAAITMSAQQMPAICPHYNIKNARKALSEGKVVIVAGGTGNPFFTTDTAATLRAVELECDGLAKATQVDGVYSDDPKKNPEATRYNTLTYDKILSEDLKIMDGAAIALARDNKLPLVVFSIHEQGNLLKMVTGEANATTVT